MSLIQTIKTKVPADLLNGGAVGVYTGQLTSGTDVIIATLPVERQFAVMTFLLTSATNVECRLGFKTGSSGTIEFFRGFVGPSGTPMILPMESWIWSDLSATGSQVSLVCTVAGTIDYTILTKIFSSKIPLNYIEEIGVKAHANPYFGLPSGKDRGQSEF